MSSPCVPLVPQPLPRDSYARAMYIIDAAERIALEASEVLAPYGITFQRYLEMEVAEDQLSSETRLFLEALRSIVGKAFEHACTAIDAKDKGPKPSRKLPQEG